MVFKIILLLGITTLGYAQPNDQLAIRKVIEAENRSYHANSDRTVYFTYWEIKPESRWAYSSKEWIEYMGAEEILKMIASDSYPPADQAKSTFTNFVVKVNAPVGWATFDVKSVGPEGKVSYAHSFYCLEKIQGTWKIISASEHGYDPNKN